MFKDTVSLMLIFAVAVLLQQLFSIIQTRRRHDRLARAGLGAGNVGDSADSGATTSRFGRSSGVTLDGGGRPLVVKQYDLVELVVATGLVQPFTGGAGTILLGVAGDGNGNAHGGTEDNPIPVGYLIKGTAMPARASEVEAAPVAGDDLYIVADGLSSDDTNALDPASVGKALEDGPAGTPFEFLVS